MKETLETIEHFFTEHLSAPHKIPSVEPEDDGYRAVVEIIEEKEYMRKYARDEMVGVYEVKLNHENEVISYSRIYLKNRGETGHWE
ncbi:gas vesicle protein GvpO [Metabacillus idriensis]|uniref:gas vesicle protein GvpO n=1 Tax=Metabacillus idriensis TaxID=324768 RepID=UPI002812B345|nr:gas vesicle protein GvpO [Metabacillus idriensis]MDR0137820.1 gas vesicle protein GvpO [Metabacillus idriensis]